MISNVNSSIRQPVRSGRRIKVALDIWDAGSPNPRGTVTAKRQFAQACALLVQSGDLQLSYLGSRTDKQWLHREGLLDYGDFLQFRIPGRLQRAVAGIRLLPLDKLLGRPNVFHSSGPYSFRRGQMQVIGTLIDFVPMRLPEYGSLNLTFDQVRWCQWAARQPEGRWISISEQTKQDALALARLHMDQVMVVNLSANTNLLVIPAAEQIAATLKSLGIQQPYLLCVNSLGLRKNHARLLEAWEQIEAAKQGWTLVLVGYGAENPLCDRLRSGAFEGVMWLGYLPGADLVHVYHGCEGVVYPSLYEGFGLAIVEAMTAGKPILTSRRSPMAELAGLGAICIDPWDVGSIANGLDTLLSNQSLRRHLGELNWARKDEFSLQRMADDLLAVYQAFVR